MFVINEKKIGKNINTLRKQKNIKGDVGSKTISQYDDERVLLPKDWN
jgi:hypothetical protein